MSHKTIVKTCKKIKSKSYTVGHNLVNSPTMSLYSSLGLKKEICDNVYLDIINYPSISYTKSLLIYTTDFERILIKNVLDSAKNDLKVVKSGDVRLNKVSDVLNNPAGLGIVGGNK